MKASLLLRAVICTSKPRCQEGTLQQFLKFTFFPSLKISLPRYIHLGGGQPKDPVKWSFNEVDSVILLLYNSGDYLFFVQTAILVDKYKRLMPQ